MNIWIAMALGAGLALTAVALVVVVALYFDHREAGRHKNLDEQLASLNRKLSVIIRVKEETEARVAEVVTVVNDHADILSELAPPGRSPKRLAER
jgi:hypothetical protein